MAALAYHLVSTVDRLLGGDPLEPPPDPESVEATRPVDIDDCGVCAGSRAIQLDPRDPASVEECGACDGTGFVITHEDGGAGYRPCFRCPVEGDAA